MGAPEDSFETRVLVSLASIDAKLTQATLTQGDHETRLRVLETHAASPLRAYVVPASALSLLLTVVVGVWGLVAH